MFRNHLKIAYRNFIRHKLYSFINVFGLAIGLSICMIISIWVLRELNYDRFHENANRIYRVERELYRDNLYQRWPITEGLYKQALIEDFPEIENAVRFWRREFAIKDHKNDIHREEVFAVDNSIFEIFDFNVEKKSGIRWLFGAIYGPLGRLVDHGYVKSFESEPLPERGGRRRVLYRLTEAGKKELLRVKELHTSLWMDAHSLKDKNL